MACISMSAQTLAQHGMSVGCVWMQSQQVNTAEQQLMLQLKQQYQQVQQQLAEAHQQIAELTGQAQGKNVVRTVSAASLAAEEQNH